MECSKLLKDYNTDCYIETLDYNKRYLTNFSGTTCEVILTPNGIEFILMVVIKHKLKVNYMMVLIFILQVMIVDITNISKILLAHIIKLELMERLL